MQINLLIFQTSNIGRFSCLPLDYYLSTCCGGPSFALAYLCRRYFWCLIIIFVGCNLDLEQNGSFTLHRYPLGHVPSLKSSLSLDSPNIMWATNKKCPQHPFSCFGLSLERDGGIHLLIVSKDQFPSPISCHRIYR